MTQTDSARLTDAEIAAMLREVRADWPRLGRMQCGELADVATTATRGVIRLAEELLRVREETTHD